jgi:hypothetical protein
MKAVFIYLFPVLFVGSLRAQTINLKAQVIYKNELLKSYPVLVDGNRAVTDFSGLLITPVVASKTQVKVQPADRRYVILYPRGGNVLIPRDNSLVTEIILGNYTDDPNLKVYNTLVKQINEASRKPGVNLAPLQQRLDSIEIILRNLNYSNEDLRSARERLDGRDLFYPEITKSLRNYIVQAIDLKNAFKYAADFAFTNKGALDKLKEAITDYNPCIEKINETHSMYARKISDYWQNDSLTKSFEGIADTILNDIHKNHILPFNDIKNKINQYFLGELSGSQNQAKIKNDISAALPDLAIKLETLESRINDFIDQLTY